MRIATSLRQISSTLQNLAATVTAYYVSVAALDFKVQVNNQPNSTYAVLQETKDLGHISICLTRVGELLLWDTVPGAEMNSTDIPTIDEYIVTYAICPANGMD